MSIETAQQLLANALNALPYAQTGSLAEARKHIHIALKEVKQETTKKVRKDMPQSLTRAQEWNQKMADSIAVNRIPPSRVQGILNQIDQMMSEEQKKLEDLQKPVESQRKNNGNENLGTILG